MKGFKLQHRVTRTRGKGSKLLEFGPLPRPLWIRRVLVGPNSPPAAHSNRWPALEPLFQVVTRVADARRAVDLAEHRLWSVCHGGGALSVTVAPQPRVASERPHQTNRYHPQSEIRPV